MDVPEGMTLKEAAGLWQMPMEKRQMHISSFIFLTNVRGIRIADATVVWFGPVANSDEHFLMKYVENAGNPREFFKGVALSFL
jgi:hypothetical protein